MEIIQYEPKYKEDVRRICINTGSPEKKTNKEHYHFSLMMYCDPYIDHETAFLILDDESKVRGYILCASNYDHFETVMKPYIDKIKRDCPNFANRTDISNYAKYKENYPAHLHIDIEESYTGNHHGTKLMQTLLQYLKDNHIKGVMLGVDKANKRAVSFYSKMGFKVLEETEFGATLGLKLD